MPVLMSQDLEDGDGIIINLQGRVTAKNIPEMPPTRQMDSNGVSSNLRSLDRVPAHFPRN